MTNTNINFNKRKLESLKSSTKPTWYYAQNFEGLALLVGKKKKTYYAHWSIPIVDKITGNIKMVGKRKKLLLVYLLRSTIILIIKFVTRCEILAASGF